MAKNNSGKKITIDKLAEIINKGFDGQMEYMGKEFGKINEKFDKVDKTLTAINKHIADTVHQPEFDKLEGRVEYLENVFDVPAKKH